MQTIDLLEGLSGVASDLFRDGRMESATVIYSLQKDIVKAQHEDNFRELSELKERAKEIIIAWDL